jgi:hypothetical protein
MNARKLEGGVLTALSRRRLDVDHRASLSAAVWMFARTTLTSTFALMAACASEPPRHTDAPHATVAKPPPALDESAIWAEFEGSERALEVAAGDCGGACVSLTTLAHDRLTLCDAKSPRCSEATARLDRDAARVEATCGSCPGER